MLSNKAYFDSMRAFDATNKLVHLVLHYIARNVANQNDLNELMKVFKNLDSDNNGTLSRDELIQGFKLQSVNKDTREIEDEVDKIIMQIDSNQSGQVDFTEFVVAAMKKDKMITRQRLEQTFQSLDIDGDGEVTRSEFIKIMGGVQDDDELWDQVLLNSCNNKGVVTFSSCVI